MPSNMSYSAPPGPAENKQSNKVLKVLFTNPTPFAPPHWIGLIQMTGYAFFDFCAVVTLSRSSYFVLCLAQEKHNTNKLVVAMPLTICINSSMVHHENYNECYIIPLKNRLRREHNVFMHGCLCKTEQLSKVRQWASINEINLIPILSENSECNMCRGTRCEWTWSQPSLILLKP